MSEESKRLWVARDKYVVDPDKSCERTVEYIRADIVDELVEALEGMIKTLTDGPDESDVMRVYTKAKSTLKKLEDV